jgi:outer membrane protein assembly factor BamE (lipoprotein component of BamABCDE complex)
MKGDTMVTLSRVRFVIIILTALCCGCAVFGKNKEEQTFNHALIDKVVPGQTTAAEITELFGAPSQVVKLSNGNAYLYKRSVAKGTGIWLVLVSFGNYEKQYDQLIFFFNDTDILTHFGASNNADKASYGLPF